MAEVRGLGPIESEVKDLGLMEVEVKVMRGHKPRQDGFHARYVIVDGMALTAYYRKGVDDSQIEQAITIAAKHFGRRHG